MDKTWNVKTYTISVLYWNIFFKSCAPVILEFLWCQPFDVNIVHTKNWRMDILTWTKPGDNLEFYG